jgi:hypothetical protein
MVVTYKQFSSIRKLENVIPQSKAHEFTPFNVKIGGFVEVISSKGEKLLCLVEDIYTYSYKKEEWFEFKLYCVHNDQTYFLEFEDDDQIEYFLSEEPIPDRKVPVSVGDIKYMADEEEGKFTYNNKTFYYEDDYKFKFKRASNPEKKEKAYVYEFEADDGTSFVMEDWGNGEYMYFLSERPQKVVVVSTGD